MHHVIFATMTQVAILLLDNSYSSSVTGLIDAFQIANTHLSRSPSNVASPIHWSLLAEKADMAVTMRGGIRILSDSAIADLERADLIYLPGIYYPGGSHMEQWLKAYRWLTPLLTKQHQQGARIAANCTATFLLGEAGLLDNRKATTTWWLEQQFKNRYPAVKLEANLALTEDKGIYCAGATTAYNQLAIRLVEETLSPEIAELCASTMLINRSLSAQTPFLDLNIPIASDDPLVSKAQYWLRSHVGANVDFVQLANELNTSQRTLIRRFKKSTGNTPLSYLQNERVEHAKRLLTHSPLSIEDIIDRVGYSDASSFQRLFKKRVGMPPSNYRQKFSQAINMP